MLASTRCLVPRTLRRASRGLSTSAETAAGEGTLTNALAAVGNIIGSEALPSLSKPPPERRFIPPPAPPVINIPPAEDPLLHYLTSCIQKHGHRQKAARTTSRMLLYIHTLTRAPPLPIVRKAIASVSPAVRCISNKHAGKTVVYPVALSEKQRTRYAIQWILDACETRGGQELEERLAKEMIAIVQGVGKENAATFSSAYRKKEEIHKYAMMNRGNAQRHG